MDEGVNLIRFNDSKIIYTNPKFDMMFGYDSGELIGKHISICNAFNDKTSKAIAEEIINCCNKEGVWRGEVKNIRKDGTTFWCLANVSLLDHLEFGKVIVSVQSDISSIKQAEEELKKYRDNLEKS